MIITLEFFAAMFLGFELLIYAAVSQPSRNGPQLYFKGSARAVFGHLTIQSSGVTAALELPCCSAVVSERGC